MLTIENLAFSFRKLQLFSNLSFSVKAGELVVIVGPNGSGKSTLMSIITGARDPDSGRVSYSDSVFPGEYLGAECNHLFLMRSALANLRVWGQFADRKLSEQELYDELKVWNLAHPFFSTQLPVARFSTGMKRRLALARVALSPKKLWLLDEPLFGLDSEAVTVFTKRLGQHIAAGGSAIVVSHDDRIHRDLAHRKININEFKESS